MDFEKRNSRRRGANNREPVRRDLRRIGSALVQIAPACALAFTDAVDAEGRGACSVFEQARERAGRIVNQRDNPLVVHPHRADDRDASKRHRAVLVGGCDHAEAGEARVDILRTDRHREPAMRDAALEQVEQRAAVLERMEQVAQAIVVGELRLVGDLGAALDIDLGRVRRVRPVRRRAPARRA